MSSSWAVECVSDKSQPKEVRHLQHLAYYFGNGIGKKGSLKYKERPKLAREGREGREGGQPGSSVR